MISETIIFLKDINPDGYDIDSENYQSRGFFVTFAPNLFRVKECREIFHDYFLAGNKVGFSKSFINIEKINEFFNILEDRLGIKEKSIFYKTDCDFLIVVELANFWIQNNFRKGMMSLFLRCAAVHYKDNFDLALTDYKLMSKISVHVNRFLDGYTSLPEGASVNSGHVVEVLSSPFVDINYLIKEQI